MKNFLISGNGNIILKRLLSELEIDNIIFLSEGSIFDTAILLMKGVKTLIAFDWAKFPVQLTQELIYKLA